MKIKKKRLFMEAQYSPGAILGNAERCAPLKIPQNASEDNIRVLFFHIVLSTGETRKLKPGTSLPPHMGYYVSGLVFTNARGGLWLFFSRFANR